METALAAVTEENQKLRRENQVLKEENQRLTSEIESAQLLAELKEELKDDFDEKLRTLFDKNQAQKALVKMQKDWDGVQAAMREKVTKVVQEWMPDLVQKIGAVASWEKVTLRILEPSSRRGGGGGGHSKHKKLTIIERERLLLAKKRLMEDKQRMLQLKLMASLKRIQDWADFKPKPPKVKANVLWGMGMTEWVNGIKSITRFVGDLQDAPKVDNHR